LTADLALLNTCQLVVAAMNSFHIRRREGGAQEPVPPRDWQEVATRQVRQHEQWPRPAGMHAELELAAPDNLVPAVVVPLAVAGEVRRDQRLDPLGLLAHRRRLMEVRLESGQPLQLVPERIEVCLPRRQLGEVVS